MLTLFVDRKEGDVSLFFPRCGGRYRSCSPIRICEQLLAKHEFLWQNTCQMGLQAIKMQAPAPTPAPKIDFAIGGQAVMEGVMMRSPNFYTVCVRNPQGTIAMKQEKFVSLTERFRLPKWISFPGTMPSTSKQIWPLKLPLVRGVVHLVESMMIGFRSLNYSNSVALGEEDPQAAPKEHGRVWKVVWKVAAAIFGALYVLATLAFTLFLLKFLPLWVAEQASQVWPLARENYLLFNAIDGLTKISIFLSYVLLISLLKDIKRVFQYHGAEHKSIWAYEKGLPLTVENARAQTRFHPRCGTSFIFFVILMSVLVYTLVPPADTFWLKFAERIAVIPIIAGVSYETLKFSAKFQKFWLMRLLVAPGLFIQRLTTREPNDEQLEIALHSLKESLRVENLNLEAPEIA